MAGFASDLSPNAEAAAPDAVSLAIFGSRVRNIAWTVGTNAIRAARSTLMQQGDLAAGMFDAAGRTIALDEHLPLMAFSLAPGVRALVAFFGADIHDGDVFIHNDVWHGNIQHADTGIFIPVFHNDGLVAWIGCRGHWSDIGGAVAGTANPTATEVWQEALRIPPLRLIAAARPIRDVWELIFANVRMRDQVESDARALIGACALGVQATADLIGRVGGGAAFVSLTEALFEATGRAIDAALAALPRRRFEGAAVFIDDAPEGVVEYPVRVGLDLAGDRVVIDFAGSAPQTAGMMNSPLTSTEAAALTTVLTLLGPGIPHNEGALSRFVVKAPAGSMLNALFPAATYGGNKMCEYIGTAIMNACAAALPGHICAEWSRRLSLRASGRDPRTGASFLEIFFLTYAGGGAAHGTDGYNQPGLMSGGNVMHQDYELMELRAPLILWKHEYAPDSAGAGQWRGGWGNETVMEFNGRDLVFVSHGGGTTEGAQGVLGGGAGARNLLEVTDATGTTRRMAARQKLGPLAPPVLLRQISGGGGGYGPAMKRDAAALARDRREGLVTEPAA